MLTSDVPTHIIWSHKASVTVRAVMTIIMSMHSYDVDFKSTRTDACVITVIALVFPDASVSSCADPRPAYGRSISHRSHTYTP